MLEETFGPRGDCTESVRRFSALPTPFLLTPFCCYAYAFAELLVLSLYQIFKREGESFVPKYIDLLASRRSGSPKCLLARIGIDIEAPGFWDAGLSFIEEVVE